MHDIIMQEHGVKRILHNYLCNVQTSKLRRVTQLDGLSVPTCTMYNVHCTNINVREALLNLSVYDLAALFVRVLFPIVNWDVPRIFSICNESLVYKVHRQAKLG